MRRCLRITIEVGGYRWYVYGSKSKVQWQSDLVELLGGVRLDVPVDRHLTRKIRGAIAEFLNLEVANVHPISADLILE